MVLPFEAGEELDESNQFLTSTSRLRAEAVMAMH